MQQARFGDSIGCAPMPRDNFCGALKRSGGFAASILHQ
jgi:hypothetical protein